MRRSWAAAIADDDGEMLVIGGQNEEKAITDTEKFIFDENTWVKGPPLPDELRNEGVEGHCIIKINKTSIFIVGGYVRPFQFKQTFDESAVPDYGAYGATIMEWTPPQETSSDNDDFFDGFDRKSQSQDDKTKSGDYAVNFAWFYDGKAWKRAGPMIEGRDRPACGLFFKEDGDFRILVTGGCVGGCFKKAGFTNFTEVYNLSSDRWEKAESLPEAISGAKMGSLGEKLILIGGKYESRGKVIYNKNLYEYEPDKDAWSALNGVKLKVGRESPVVFPVPRSYFNSCTK